MDIIKEKKFSLLHIFNLMIIAFIWLIISKLTSYSLSSRVLILIMFQLSIFIYIINNRMEKQKISVYFFLHFKKTDILWGLLIAYLNLKVATIITLFLPEIDSFVDKIPDKMGLIKILMFISICLWGPFVEELLFRGFIWKIFKDKNINNFIILLLTSLLFSLYHFEIVRIPMLFVSGIILGFSRYKSGRMGIAIIGHIVNNTYVFFISQL